ncbi:MAG: hypothetical protein AAF799_38710 [Myxococcota bacterium]
MAILVDEAESDASRRYTDEGITVVALDRRGRGLHRARPERRSHGRSRRAPAARRWVAPVAFLVVALVVLAIAQLW